METSPQYLETSAQYREFAEECDRFAKQATTEGDRKILEEMAEAWRMVAAEADTKRESSVSRQPRLHVLLPNETILAPCVAAKPALAHLLRCAPSLGTLERSADTVPTLSRRDPLRLSATRKRHRCSFPLAKNRRCAAVFPQPSPFGAVFGRAQFTRGRECREALEKLC